MYGQSMDYFSVMISIVETVEVLKKAIRNENPKDSHNVGTKDLTLFKGLFTFSKNSSLKNVFNAYTISSLEKHLQSLQRLSAIFNPKPPNDELHIIVDIWHY